MIYPQDATQAWPRGSLQIYGSVRHELARENDLIAVEEKALHFLRAIADAALYIGEGLKVRTACLSQPVPFARREKRQVDVGNVGESQNPVRMDIRSHVLYEEDAVQALFRWQLVPFLAQQVSIHHAAELADEAGHLVYRAYFICRQRDKGVRLHLQGQFNISGLQPFSVFLLIARHRVPSAALPAAIFDKYFRYLVPDSKRLCLTGQRSSK